MKSLALSCPVTRSAAFCCDTVVALALINASNHSTGFFAFVMATFQPTIPLDEGDRPVWEPVVHEIAPSRVS